MTAVKRRLASSRRPAVFILRTILFILLLDTIAAEKNPQQQPEESAPLEDDAAHQWQHTDDESWLPANVLREENGILVLTQAEHIPEAATAPLLLVALYSPTCQHSGDLMPRIEEVALRMKQYVNSLPQPSISPPRFAKIDVSWMEPAWLETLEVTSIPALLWLIPSFEEDDHADDDILFVDVLGPTQTVEELLGTVRHAWYRSQQEGPVWRADSLNELDQMVQVHGAGLFLHLMARQHPSYTTEEQSIIEWIMMPDAVEKDEDPFVVFVHCPEKDGGKREQIYEEAAQVLGTRSDLAFFTLTKDCGGVFVDRNISTVAIMVPSSLQDWKDWRRNSVILYPSRDMPLLQFMETQSTPSVMWFDRTTVAPIAFPAYRKIHATLFVPLSQDVSSRRAVGQFRTACRTRGRDALCMVVPHTEKRILTTFGIDPWSPLDAQATQQQDEEGGEPLPPVFPTLLLTDQRYNGTLKYYLDASTIRDDAFAIVQFLQKFWDGCLKPFIRSSSTPLRRNKNHLQIITGNTFQEAILEDQDRHALLFLYAPTCGHCIRFSNMWNKLARLIHKIGWDSFLNIAKLDVTENDVFTKGQYLDVHLLPQVCYFPKGTEKHQHIQFANLDDFGDGAGRLTDPVEIIAWLMGIADDPEFAQESLVRRLDAAGM